MPSLFGLFLKEKRRDASRCVGISRMQIIRSKQTDFIKFAESVIPCLFLSVWQLMPIARISRFCITWMQVAVAGNKDCTDEAYIAEHQSLEDADQDLGVQAIVSQLI